MSESLKFDVALWTHFLCTMICFKCVDYLLSWTLTPLWMCIGLLCAAAAFRCYWYMSNVVESFQREKLAKSHATEPQ